MSERTIARIVDQQQPAVRLGWLGSVVLPGDASSVPLARAFTRSVLRMHGFAVDEYVVLLVVSELVANSVRHSDSGRRSGGQVTVWLAHVSPILHVDVADEGAAGSAPLVRQVETDSDGGRGLELVEEIVLKWGTYKNATGRVVWADIAIGAGVP